MPAFSKQLPLTVSPARRFCRRWLAPVLLLALVAGFAPWRMSAAEAPVEAPEYNVKAGYLLLFAEHTSWPTNAAATSPTPIVIGVLGSDPFQGALERTARRQTGSRPFEVRSVANEVEAAQCHVVFISKAEKANEARWLAALRDKPILTVGESGQTLALGGVVEFVELAKREKRLRFEVSRTAITQAGLKLDSRMLSSARQVYDKRPAIRD